MPTELAAGDRVRSLRGSRAGAMGTVVQCSAHYVLVNFADGSSARRTRRAPAARQAALPTKKHKKTLERCTRQPTSYGALPVDLAEKIMGLLLLDQDVGLMAAICTCRRWRDAAAICAWTRVDADNGLWDVRAKRAWQRDNADAVVGDDQPAQRGRAEAFFHRWMLHMADGDARLPALLLCFRCTNHIPADTAAALVERASNLQELHLRGCFQHQDKLMPMMVGKPLRSVSGIDFWSETDLAVMATLTKLETLKLRIDPSTRLMATLSDLPSLRSLSLFGQARSPIRLKLRCRALESLTIRGKLVASLDFGTYLPQLTEYCESEQYCFTTADVYLQEVLHRCCPRIDLGEFDTYSMTERGVWGGPGARERRNTDPNGRFHFYVHEPTPTQFHTNRHRAAAMAAWSTAARNPHHFGRVGWGGPGDGGEPDWAALFLEPEQD